MIKLDGSEAGGQFVRTAVALSALTNKPVEVLNIRGARPKPGLKAQHIEGIAAVAKLSNAEVKGLELGSCKLTFIPSEIQARDLEIKISTAGSIGLVLQALLLASARLSKPINVHIVGGGTWGKWAPPLEYLKYVFLPLLESKTEIEIIKDGFYPKGGAEVKIKIYPWKEKEIIIEERGKLEKLLGVSIASLELQRAHVAERQVDAAGMLLRQKLGKTLDCNVKYVRTMSKGSGMLIYAKTQNSVLGGDAIGEIAKRAEDVGKEAAKNLLIDFLHGSVDRHAADMLLSYMALAGNGKIKTPAITQHILTSVHVIEHFLPVKFKIKGEKGKPGTIAVEPKLS